MLRIMVILFGIAFIFVGVAGFLSTFMINDLLFGLFEVNTLLSLIHIISGVIAIMAATSFKYTRLYFQIFGIVYTLVALIGFWRNGDIYIVRVNMANNILNLVIGVIAIYLGFSSRERIA